MRPEPPGWGSLPPPYLSPRRRPELGGVAVLVVVTVLATLAAPHVRTFRGLISGGLAELGPSVFLAAARLLAMLGPGRRHGRVRRSPSSFASGASRIAGAPKAPTPTTAPG